MTEVRCNPRTASCGADQADSPEWTATERGVVFAAVLATSMAFIDATALNVAVPALQADLAASAANMLWTINGYGLMVASLLLLGGVLGDRFGRRRVCIVGIVLFSLASLACGGSRSATELVTARFLQGAGAALMIPASLAMITAGVHPRRRGKAIGIWSACTVVTSALGPVLGGLLASGGWWRGVFLINLPLAILAICALRRWVPESRSEETRHAVDLPGAGCAVLTLAGLNYGLIEGAAQGFRQPRVWGALGGSLAMSFLFVVVEQRSQRPLLPLRLFQNRTLLAVCLLTLLFYSGVYGMMFFLSLNLITVQRYNEARAGIAQLPLMILVVLLSGWAGGIYDRHGPRWPLIGGTALAGIGFVGLAVPGITDSPKDYWQSYLPGLLILGAGMGITIAPLSSTLMTALSEHHAGLASGLNSTLSRLSSVLGMALLGPVALVVFNHSVASQARNLPLDRIQHEQLLQQTSRFVQARLPAGLAPTIQHEVQLALDQAFIRAFRWVACLSAAAAWLGMIVAAAWVRFPLTSLGNTA